MGESTKDALSRPIPFLYNKACSSINIGVSHAFEEHGLADLMWFGSNSIAEPNIA